MSGELASYKPRGQSLISCRQKLVGICNKKTHYCLVGPPGTLFTETCVGPNRARRNGFDSLKIKNNDKIQIKVEFCE